MYITDNYYYRIWWYDVYLDQYNYEIQQIDSQSYIRPTQIKIEMIYKHQNRKW